MDTNRIIKLNFKNNLEVADSNLQNVLKIIR